MEESLVDVRAITVQQHYQECCLRQHTGKSLVDSGSEAVVLVGKSLLERRHRGVRRGFTRAPRRWHESVGIFAVGSILKYANIVLYRCSLVHVAD